MADSKTMGKGIIALGVIFLILMLALIVWQVNLLNGAKEEVATGKAALVSTEKRLQELVKAKEKAAETRERMEKAMQIMPDQPGEHAFINDIKNKADDSGTHFLHIRFEERVSREGYVEMPFKASFKGHYPGLVELVNYIKEGPRAVRVDELKFSKDKQEELIKVDITASCFYQSSQ